ALSIIATADNGFTQSGRFSFCDVYTPSSYWLAALANVSVELENFGTPDIIKIVEFIAKTTVAFATMQINHLDNCCLTEAC
ncbi:14484_t:CDS:2, partial [Funneliformis mosseae]